MTVRKTSRGTRLRRRLWNIAQESPVAAGRSVPPMAADLSGMVIVLTGGADGIGRECALAYAREGATVAILDRDFDRAQITASEAGKESIGLRADVSDGSAVQVAVHAVLEQFGRIDAVHNNAGIASPSKPLH